MLHLYDFHISFYMLLVSNSYILVFNIPLCDAIATFAPKDSATYFVAVELGISPKFGRQVVLYRRMYRSSIRKRVFM
jgi:nitrate reductase gamma subunit